MFNNVIASMVPVVVLVACATLALLLALPERERVKRNRTSGGARR